MRISNLLAFVLWQAIVGTGFTAAAEDPAQSARHAKLDVDVSEVPEMAHWAEQVKDVAVKWYPILAFELPGEGFSPPEHVTITFKKDMQGVAYTSGSRVVCASAWFKKHPEDVGAIVHELTHVIQQYGNQGEHPGWLVEGIADYERFFFYEPIGQRPHPNPDKSTYHDSYRTSAAFLDWVVRKYDPDFVVELNQQLRRGTYDEAIFEKRTGKTLASLGEEWKKSLGSKGAA